MTHARLRILPALVAALVALVGVAPSARGATAFFPGDLPPATQVTRDLTMQEAAQRGLIKLQSKGGGQGDAVSLELQHKQVRAPITVTVRVEFTVASRVTPPFREAVRNAVPDRQAKTEANLNRFAYKTRRGDPIRFKLDYVYREPEEAPRRNYHQALLANPTLDIPEPDPDFRSEVDELGVPNGPTPSGGTFTPSDFEPITLAHETLHLAGLDDRYADFYRLAGRDYPLPAQGLSPSALRQFRTGHRPPLPAGGKVVVKNVAGTGRCDIMGIGFADACRRISQRDLDWFESQAGVQVSAQPGDLLLNKDAESQNLGVGFQTTVFATPGSTTVANGIAVYCLDHDLVFPLSQGFDVAPAGQQLPGYEDVVRLLELNARIQPNLDESVDGMQAAIWNATDGRGLEFSGTAEESRALLAQAGVAEDARPAGLPTLSNANAGSPETASVGADAAVQPTIAAQPTKPALSVRVGSATLFPSRLRAGRGLRSDLLVSASGDVARLALRLERRVGSRWRSVRSLPGRALEPGSTPIPLSLGRLRAGRYRVTVTVTPPFGDAAVATVALTVR